MADFGHAGLERYRHLQNEELIQRELAVEAVTEARCSQLSLTRLRTWKWPSAMPKKFRCGKVKTEVIMPETVQLLSMYG